MTKKIGIYNLERNTSKTTSAAFLAEGLASLQQSVLLVDLNSDRALQSYLGLDFSEINNNKTQKFSGSNFGWDFKPFNELLLDSQKFENEIEDYQYVIFDFPSYKTDISESILNILDSVIIPIDCEFYGLENLGKTLSSVLEVPNLIIEGLLLTKYDISNVLMPKFLETLKSNFVEILLNTIIARNYYLGLDKFNLDNLTQTQSHFGFADYLKLANEITDKNNGKE